jgi:hypothetical protein
MLRALVRPLLLLTALFAASCQKEAPLPHWGDASPRPQWLEKLARNGPDTITWGSRNQEFVYLGSRKAPSAAARETLKSYFSRPRAQLFAGPNKCFTHIDGALFVGGVAVELCFSCNHYFARGGEQLEDTLVGLKELKPVFEAELGKRPPEPAVEDGY